MNITSVSYVKLFPLGMYINEKIGVEVSLEAGEDAMLALDTARNLVHEYHEKNNPIPFAGVTAIADNPTIPNVQVDKEPPKSLVEQIESCTELKVLESYRLIAKTNPECQTAYDNKLKELQK